MNAELYYLVGKPDALKQSMASVLRQSLSEISSVFIPEIFTTDDEISENENYRYIDERNFRLRQSMDVYSLSWKKQGHFFGVNGDISQRLNSGVDVVINGSFHNLKQARQQFPNINIVLIRREHVAIKKHYLIAEDDEVRLEFDGNKGEMGFLYMLTMMSGHGMGNALDMLLMLISNNRSYLKNVG